MQFKVYITRINFKGATCISLSYLSPGLWANRPLSPKTSEITQDGISRGKKDGERHEEQPGVQFSLWIPFFLVSSFFLHSFIHLASPLALRARARKRNDSRDYSFAFRNVPSRTLSFNPNHIKCFFSFYLWQKETEKFVKTLAGWAQKFYSVITLSSSK